MSRIAKLAVEDWDPALRALLNADALTPLEQGLMRMFAHRPEIAKGLTAFAAALKCNRTLPERLIELVRLRVAFHNQCRSCMAIRYRDAVADGADETAVCSIERPAEADNLSPAEKAAIRYGELLATNHLAIDESVYEELRAHFTEAQIVELGLNAAFFVGFGRLAATFDMVEELPATFQDKSTGKLAPWHTEHIVVR